MDPPKTERIHGDLFEGRKQQDVQSLGPPAIRRVHGDFLEGRNRISIQLHSVRPGKHRAALFHKHGTIQRRFPTLFRDPIFRNIFVLKSLISFILTRHLTV